MMTYREKTRKHSETMQKIHDEYINKNIYIIAKNDETHNEKS